jgi:hypothetical protein
LVARKKYIYLCTNALLLKEKIGLFKPSKYLTFSVHLDGSGSTMIFPFAAKADTTRRSREYERPSNAASALPPTPRSLTAPTPTACAPSLTR